MRYHDKALKIHVFMAFLVCSDNENFTIQVELTVLNHVQYNTAYMKQRILPEVSI